MAVRTGPGIQELDPVDVDEIPVVFGTRLFVVPRFRALPAFEINAGTVGQFLLSPRAGVQRWLCSVLRLRPAELS